MLTLEAYKELKAKIDTNFSVYQLKQQELKDTHTQILNTSIEIQNLSLITAFFNKIVDTKRKEIIERIINLVSFGLQSIMEDPTLKLCISESMQRNQKTYSFSVSKNGNNVSIMDGSGGGIINLISFLLHVVFLSISSNRKFLVLDEPFANLSVNYRENIGTFLKLLAEKTGIQFLIVSHQDEVNELADVLYTIKDTPSGVQFIKS